VLGTVVRSLGRTAGFAALYVLATYAGRLTVMDATNLSLVWPAAGILAVWFVAQRHSRWQWVDVVALIGITLVVNVATGTGPVLTGFFVAANLAQAYAFTFLLGRWLPDLWSGSATGAVLTRLHELWRFIAAAAVATGCGALIGPTGVWLVSEHYSIEATLVWLTRNTVSILLVGVATSRIGRLVPDWWRHRRTRETPVQRWHRLPLGRQAEYLALIAVSALAYYLAFGVARGLPVAFALITTTIWAGLRTHTTFVVLHDLTFGTVAVLFTLHGDGPFGAIASHPVRALIAQLFVGTVAVVGLALALSRDERDALITQTREQAALMTTILDNVSEGIGVVDENGHFLLRNPAVGVLLGGVTSPTGHIQAAAYYGLFHPDGTPLADEDLPYRRALSGAAVAPMDILIRNAGIPEGRVVSQTATLLPGRFGDRRCAVVALHDVTADRRHRDELAKFAGVVAHDLLNPLATIEGWSDLLQQDITDPDDEIAAGLIRIQRASARMRNLINDLLAYTTARDAALSPARFDLAAVVGDIVVGRVDHAESSGQDIPVIRTSGLGMVDGDQVLIRQVFDNLIGNAIKYTAPGVTPHLTVDGHPDPDRPDLIRVDITDNGIGIPAGQHEAVFGNFHRAHREAGYAGTGLGLAICKRVVERHGGTITAADNPAGPGSRITVRLPYAEPDPDRARATVLAGADNAG